MGRTVVAIFSRLTILAVCMAATAGDVGEPSRRLVNDRCPVTTDEFASPLHEIQFKGVAVRFCCAKCQRRFQENPEAYLAHLPQLSPAAAQAAAAEVQGDALARHDARTAHAEGFVDRWFRPLLASLAVLIAGWLALRLARRGISRSRNSRRLRKTSAVQYPGSRDEEE